ncbi:MAG TPA: GSU2403 family nucleotidyltransferase fold protein [Pyrinomonadaceae bacterium]|nr:GSU2403 family nucleotidyltransferase fold protein [Pyrinomonadaceae bacterium]
MEDLKNFGRLVEALRPWLPHLVIVGGWAHRLHRFHPLATSQEYQPLRTRDVDLAFSLNAPLEGDLSAALMAAGFEEELSGEHTPPVTHYYLGEQDAGFYAEFLTVKEGSGIKRDGKPDLTISRAGITAQKLRYLELLLAGPWKLRLGAESNVPIARAVDLVVANPVSFIVQKLLIHKQRDAAKKAQDILYIHDTLELFGASLHELQMVWANEIRPRISAKKAKEAVRTASVLFENVTDTIRNAARIPGDRNLQPENLRAAIHYGLGEVLAFGGGSKS